MDYKQYFDHTNLKARAAKEDIEQLCREAVQYQFQAVCVNPCRVSLAASLLSSSPVKVCTVIGFPLGANTTAVKCFEAEQAIKDGAEEVDMVVNLGAIKDGQWDLVCTDIKEVVKTAGDKAIVKVILETCYLSEEEIEKACVIAKEAGAHFVKTSTGFGTNGAEAEQVRLMRKTVGESMGVKASGGIKDAETWNAMVEGGASRIGCSASVRIMNELKK